MSSYRVHGATGDTKVVIGLDTHALGVDKAGLIFRAALRW